MMPRTPPFSIAMKSDGDLPSDPSPGADLNDTAGDAVISEQVTLPSIVVGSQMDEVGAKAEGALDGDPDVYQRGGRLVRVCLAPKSDRLWLRGAEGDPVIQEWTPVTLRSRLSARAVWYVPDGRAKSKLKRDVPPEWVARLLLEGGNHIVPLLVGLQEAPTLRPDGSLLDQPGYDADTGLYYVAGRAPTISIPSRPSLSDARRAISILAEPLAEFPFAAPSDRSAAMAAILTPVCRRAILGPCPLFLYNGSTPGLGKTMLADIDSLIAYGRPAPAMAYDPDDAEMRKRITSIALAGSSFILIDNLESGQPFGSPSLDLTLTKCLCDDRVLGSNRRVVLPVHTVWMATGSNVTVRGDLARRTVPIRLASTVERPEDRTFEKPRLLSWVADNRARLLGAALTAVRAYFVAGRPPVVSAIGSFEDWSDIIRSTLIWSGEPDPCEGRIALRVEADPQVEATTDAIREWFRVFASQPIRGSDLVESRDKEMRKTLIVVAGSKDGKSIDPRRIGPWIQKFRDRPLAGLALRRYVKESRGSRWYVERIGSGAGS